MIGQLKFAWIDFRRSFSSSFTLFVNQIITYATISVFVGVAFILNKILYWKISYIFYRTYVILSIIFVIFAFLIGIIVTNKTAKQKFMVQKKDISLMKDIGGKSQWIYSYIMFSHMISGIITLIIGLFSGIIILAIILGIFKQVVFFEYIKFIPVLGGCLVILVVHYLRTHFEIIKYLGEKDFIKVSKGLSQYKSIFEFDKLIEKFNIPVKLGIKNFLRSGEIISSIGYIFILSSAAILFTLAPITAGNTMNYAYTNQINNLDHIVGTEAMVDFFSDSMRANTFNETSTFKDDTKINNVLISELDSLGINIQQLYIEKRQVYEVNVTVPISDTGGEYRTIGKNRKINATIIGYTNESILEDRIIEEKISNTNEKQIIIGDSLSHYIFENSLAQKLQIKGVSSKFTIFGVVRDIFSSGFTIYMPMDIIREVGIAEGPNCLLIDDDIESYNNIKSLVESYNLKVKNLNDIGKQVISQAFSYAKFVNVFGFLFTIVIALRLVAFSILYIRAYFEDYKLKYMLGIKRQYIDRSYIVSIQLHLILGAFLGTFFSSIITRYFVVPRAYFPLFIMWAVLICIVLLCVGAIGSKVTTINIRKQMYREFTTNQKDSKRK